MGGFRDEQGRLRWYVWVGLALVVGVIALFLAARSADSFLRVGKVESLRGNEATVLVGEWNRSFKVENIDPNLKVGDTVVLGVSGDQSDLQATSPWMVKSMIVFKDLVP